MKEQKTDNLFKRQLADVVISAANSFPVTVVTGPRQSGKTTLLKYLFPERRYLNLEDPDTLLLIGSDIRGFLAQHHPCIIDEAQRLPELFSYLQGAVDEYSQPGRFILSGSQNFLLSEKISQTLAGRAAILELLPLSFVEYLSHEQQKSLSLWQYLYDGSYPRPYQEHLDVKLWFNSYIRTYLERDVRTLVNVKDLNTFQRFIHLCAGRHGQILNLNEIANDAGISQTTATHWLNILEASYLIYRLQPYYKNFSKRVIKRPKLYFYDTGLVCRLLGIESAEHLAIHASRGHLFEGFIISEFIKYFFSQGEPAPVYFWRDHRGVEIDLIVEKGDRLLAFEIKSSATFTADYVKNALLMKQFAEKELSAASVVYTGDQCSTYKEVHLLPWKQLLTDIPGHL
jgi:predicted AAA+ superfamily ATPase